MGEALTISDKEAADRLGFPLRSLRVVIDRERLCLRVGRRRRLTPGQFEALQEALTPPCRSSSTKGRPVSGTSGASSKGDALMESARTRNRAEAEQIRAQLETDLFRRAVL